MTLITLDTIVKNILLFQEKNHPAWDASTPFSQRIQNLPLYFLEFNHVDRGKVIPQSVTVTHYVPCRAELMALATIIQSYGKDLAVCDMGCGNGFLGSLLAREGVSVFGIDDRSWKQPQIPDFYDSDSFKVTEASLKDPSISFDVAFCSWIQPGANLMPFILEKNPSLIIHFFSPDKQPDGLPTTGIAEAYQCPDNYNFLTAWKTTVPKNFFAPLTNITGLTLSENPCKNRVVVIFAHKKLNLHKPATPYDFQRRYYNWDLEREFINGIRRNNDLPEYTLEVIEPTG